MPWRMQFTGGKELAAQLKGLADALQRDIVNDALVAAAEPMRATAANLAPRGPDPPHIADNIGVQVLSQSAAREEIYMDFAARIGPTKGSSGDFFYGHFWEWGWKFHPQAHPFMRPAFDETSPAVLRELSAQFWIAIAKAVKR